MFTGGGIYLLTKMTNKQAVIFTLGIFIFFFSLLYLISSDVIILVIDILLIIAAVCISMILKEKKEA